MKGHITNWVEEFLRHRELTQPDGRALYAYRCTAEEFSSLGEALSHTNPDGGDTSAVTRAFVLYAAEWWQRRYDGRHWAWEPLLASVGWGVVHYPDLYDPIRDALRWWRVDLVRLPTSVRYLGTFACQGGLPLALVSNDQRSVTQYLRAVLKYAAEYRQFVDDPIELARDQQHLLRPPTLRRDYVFRLAADLIEAVLDLEGDAQGEDPLSALDQVRPDWRDTMPLDLESERAHQLLTSLLREATKNRASPVNDFRVERFLRRTGVGWRLGARVRLPVSLSADHLARRLGISALDLPPRLQVRVQGDRVRIVGLYAQSSEDHRLTDARAATEIWDTEAAGEIRLQFLAGGVIGESVVPSRGGVLGELPWAFRGDRDECPFIGEGSVSNRAPEIVALVPDGCTAEDWVESAWAEPAAETDEGPSSRTKDEIRVLDRVLWRIAKPTTFETGSGRCVIRPSSQATEEEYRLSGQRFYDFEAAWPLFRNAPKLRIAKAEQAPRAVPANQVTWRQTGGDWCQHPNASGLWEVRHVRDGELRYLGRCGVLPAQFGLLIEPGSDMSEGHLVFNEAEAVRVASLDREVVLTMRGRGDAVRVHVTAQDRDAAPPVNLRLRLHWHGAAPLPVRAPFPGQGGRFLRDGGPLDGELAVDDLYGVRATALSPDGSQNFRIEGVLKAPDLGNLLRVAHFRCSLRKSGVFHELPLIDARPMIESLLTASSSSDAQVTLRILDRHGKEHGITQVSRFAAELEYDPSMAFVSVSSTLDDEPAETFAAFPLVRPSAEPVTLGFVGPADAPHGAVTSDLDTREPWLVAARHADGVRVQPIVIGGRPGQSEVYVGVRDAEGPCLPEAMRYEDRELRVKSIAAAMDVMVEEGNPKRDEEDWSFLTDALLRAEGLPATAFDFLRVLVTKPKLLVRCMFRLESAPRQLLWRLEDELPFSWLLIRRNIWWTEAKRAFERLRGQLAGAIDRDHDQIARDYVNSILTEGADRLSALETVETDVALRLEGGRVSDQFVDEVRGVRNDETPGQIRLRASQDDWPSGDGRNEWQRELERGELLGRLGKAGLWQSRDEHRVRQPMFDTPVAAAWCCFFSKPTSRTAFLVKRIRMHDPDWFDLAYKAAWFQLAFFENGISK